MIYAIRIGAKKDRTYIDELFQYREDAERYIQFRESHWQSPCWKIVKLVEEKKECKPK